MSDWIHIDHTVRDTNTSLPAALLDHTLVETMDSSGAIFPVTEAQYIDWTPRGANRIAKFRIVNVPITQSRSTGASLADRFPHYHKRCGYQTVDVYRVLAMFEVTDPCIQHAVKKLLVAGQRGAKDIDKDISEAIATLTRWQLMRNEDRTLAEAE